MKDEVQEKDISSCLLSGSDRGLGQVHSTPIKSRKKWLLKFWLLFVYLTVISSQEVNINQCFSSQVSVPVCGSFLAEVEGEIFTGGRNEKHMRQLNRVCYTFPDIHDLTVAYVFAKHM